MAAYVFDCSLKCGRTDLHERSLDRQAEIGAGSASPGPDCSSEVLPHCL
jgi:hypothetical protein